jgi:hypothetical protein
MNKIFTFGDGFATWQDIINQLIKLIKVSPDRSVSSVNGQS